MGPSNLALGPIPWNRQLKYFFLSFLPSRRLHTYSTPRLPSHSLSPANTKTHLEHSLYYDKSPCLAIIPISSCAASSPASPSADSVTSATANALYAIPTSGQRRSCASVTNAPSATTRTSASSAVARELVTLSTVLNAPALRRIAMAVPKL